MRRHVMQWQHHNLMTGVIRLASRQYSIITAAPSQQLDIPRGGNRTVSINVHSPLISTADASPTALLYFNRGPILQDSEVDDEAIKVLRSTLPCHIIQVNYKLDGESPFPHAIYDSVAAFDWTVENILPERSGKWSGKSSRNGRLATCGELLGGSLATMLALTECRATQTGIVAAAVNNPVLDWTNLSPVRRLRGRKKKQEDYTNSMPGLEVLEAVRSRFFRRPEDYYDPFASPMLFFRSAGSAPLPSPTGPAEAFTTANKDDDTRIEVYDHEESSTETSSGLTPSSQDRSAPMVRTIIEQRPRSSRQFPSRAYGLSLPAFYMTSGKDSILAPQVEEIDLQLRQSMLRQRKSRPGRRSQWSEDSYFDHDPLRLETLQEALAGEQTSAEQTAYLDSRMCSKYYQGSGLWSDASHGPAMLHDMANWLRVCLAE